MGRSREESSGAFSESSGASARGLPTESVQKDHQQPGPTVGRAGGDTFMGRQGSKLKCAWRPHRESTRAERRQSAHNEP